MEEGPDLLPDDSVMPMRWAVVKVEHPKQVLSSICQSYIARWGSGEELRLRLSTGRL